MVSRRFLAVVSIITTAAAFFLLGVFHERTDDAAVRATYDARFDALRAELRTRLGPSEASPPIVEAGTTSGARTFPSCVRSSARSAANLAS